MGMSASQANLLTLTSRLHDIEYKAQNIEIPYIKQNQKNKLRQLAQQNNREFKKLLHAKADFSLL